MSNKKKAEASARTALARCLQLKQEETLLVVCDPPCFDVGTVLWEVGRSMCREAVMIQISPREQNGNEPPDQVAEMFGTFDVAVMPTSKSLTHTQARRNACAKGTRIATLPGITMDTFERTMDADWEGLCRETTEIAETLTNAKTVHIVTESGTDLSFEIGSRTAKADCGVISESGAYGNLPAGEAFLAPEEGTAQGVLVIDGSFPIAGILDTPLRLKVKDGFVVEASGHPCAVQLNEIFDTYGQNARNIAEFGVGTLPTARITGNILEDEKVKGTIHIAVGDNASMGGGVHVPVHFDGIVRHPDVMLDGRKWMMHGELSR